MSRIEIPCAVIETIDHSMLRITYKNEYDIHLADVTELNDVLTDLVETGPIYSIVNANSKFFNLSKDAQEYLATTAPIVSRIKGSAVLINNLPIRLIVRFFISTYNPKFPTKIFKHEEEAKEWIESLRKEET